MYYKQYSFCKNQPGIFLASKDSYDSYVGAGFVDLSQKERGKDRFTGTGGWNPGGRGIPHENPSIEDGNDEVEIKKGRVPLRFRAAVPCKGVYRVTVKIQGGDRPLTGLCLYTGRRNLVKRDITVAPGEVFECCFFHHVCEYIPVVGKPAALDLSIYVTVVGMHAALSSVTIEEAQAPTLFLAGDSLVADYDGLYPYNPLLNGGSWAQNLLRYFDRIAVSNQAHGGLTTNCFRDDGHWDVVWDNLREGDIFMMEFGHNDQKRRNLKAFDQYAANLRWYILQVRKRKAFPVLVTPLSRIPGENQEGYFDLLEDFAESCRRVGKECQVPVIDLHSFSFETLCNMGREVSKNYFNDTTHTNDYGAVLMSDFVAQEIRRLNISPLYEGMNSLCQTPWEPDESLRWPGGIDTTQKEDKPILSIDLPELPYEDCKDIPMEEQLKEAMSLGLLDPCIRYLHPFAPMPRAQFLYILFKAIKNPRTTSYQGRYCDIYRYEFDANLVQGALEGNLIDETTTPDDRFRPDEDLTGGELVSFVIRGLLEPEKRNLSIKACEAEARKQGLLKPEYRRNAPVDRSQSIEALVWLIKERNQGKR